MQGFLVDLRTRYSSLQNTFMSLLQDSLMMTEFYSKEGKYKNRTKFLFLD